MKRKTGIRTVLMILIASVAILFTSCRKDEGNTPQMTMVVSMSDMRFALAGSGEVSINWGDGTPKETYTLNAYSGDERFSAEHLYTHRYSDVNSYTIRTTGSNITHLFCKWCRLTSLDVSKNHTLTYLDFYGAHDLTTLDVSRNSALTYLNFRYSYLTTIDVSRNSALTYLNCENNALTGFLDVSKNSALTYLNCNFNALTGLDVSKNSALTYLNCDHNQLTDLDVGRSSVLTDLDYGNNQLTNLDVSKNIELTSLYCDHNQLTSLDVSNNCALTDLDCGNNQLINLDMSTNIALRYLYCSYNNLQADALNDLFTSLHDNPISEGKTIRIAANPGRDTCDKNIATDRGWRVIY